MSFWQKLRYAIIWPNLPHEPELSFKEQQKITAILESYCNNHDNSRYRHQLFAYLNKLLVERTRNG